METRIKNKAERGFAVMDAEQQRKIAKQGGQSVAPENRSFSRDRELARKAGAAGGRASHGNRKAKQAR